MTHRPTCWRAIVARRARYGLPTPLLLALAAALLVAACQGCRGPKPPGDGAAPASAEATTPTVRLYLLSALSGALEPCGCAADQRGGIDHLAAALAADGPERPERLLLAAGPLFFVDPQSEPDRAAQDGFKAEAIAEALGEMKLAAWAPGFNDWAAGAKPLAALTKRCGAHPLAVGLRGSGAQGGRLLEAGGLKIGVIGLSTPAGPVGTPPPGVQPPKPAALAPLARAQMAALHARGARLVVVLAAMQRGAAMRLAEAVEGIGVMLVGAPMSPGDGNTAQPAPELVGRTLVVQTANHGQSLAVVDVYVRDAGTGPLSLSDGGAVKRAAEQVTLDRRIDDLARRIEGWTQSGKVAAADIEARQRQLARLRARRAVLAAQVLPPPKGSFYRYRTVPIDSHAGQDQTVSAIMDRYYRRVGEHNKRAFADRKPASPGPDEAGYLGAEACAGCHAQATEVWKATAHARAYATLSKQHKEYNLDCVSCHVTGYGKPGGSTLTHNAELQNVQCESCHGPGSKHAAAPTRPGLISRALAPADCRERCHHPPHVEHFDPQTRLPLILGPGHGR